MNAEASTAGRLLELVTRAEVRVNRLTRDELRALPGLYRRVVSELAEARARGATRRSVAPTEQLLLRAHSLLYVSPPPPLVGSLVGVLAQMPAAARRASRRIALAALLLCVGTAAGYLEVQRDPRSAAALISADWLENAEGFAKGGPKREGAPVYGVFYFTNNTRAALAAYALGTSFAIGTVLALVFNGLVLGVTLGVLAPRGAVGNLLDFMSAHGGIELLAIFIAAAAGLEIGWAMLRPGFRTRGEALRDAAIGSLPLALGTALLLAVAGLLEGWVSPMPLGHGIKAMIGVATTGSALLWLAFGNKQRREITR